jgi:hypothetical protein
MYDAEMLDLAGMEQLSLEETASEVVLPSLDSFNVSDEMSVLKVKLALAQSEVSIVEAVSSFSNVTCELNNYMDRAHQCTVPILTIMYAVWGRSHAQITRLKATIHALANPQGLYFVEGVQVDLPESMLKGWTCYYHAPYYNATTTDDIMGPELGYVKRPGFRQ